MTSPETVVLWLDLAKTNQVEDRAISQHLPADARVLRATTYGAPKSPRGTPERWAESLHAIDVMFREASATEQSDVPRHYIVTGRAGVPAFVYLGFLLSGFAKVTFIHQPHNAEGAEVYSLRKIGEAREVLVRQPPTLSHSDSTAPVALLAAAVREPSNALFEQALQVQGEAPSAIVRLRTPVDLSRDTAFFAQRELDAAVRDICDKHPMRSTLALFVAGPSVLAFLAGRALNPGVCRNVQVFEYEGDRYRPAFALPYPPTPDRSVVVCLMAQPQGEHDALLQAEAKAIRSELDVDSAMARLTVEVVDQATPGDLTSALRKQPGILHFSGHGARGALAFEDQSNQLRALPRGDLVETLRLYGESVRLVVLNACFSDSLDAILPWAGCIITMHDTVSSVDAIEFARVLYRELALGVSIDEAFHKAKNDMRLERSAAHAKQYVYDPHAPVTPVATPSTRRADAPVLLERTPGLAARSYIVRRR